METEEIPKRLVVIHAPADSEQLEELEKQLAPLKDTGKLSLWHQGKVRAGEMPEDALQGALQPADMVLLWVSPDLWYENPLYRQLLQNQRLIPASCQVIPLIARESNWEDEPFLQKFSNSAIPAGRRPAPAGKGSQRDAWFAAVAREIAERLSLAIPKPKPAPPLWKRKGIWFALAAIFLLAAAGVGYRINKNRHPAEKEKAGVPAPEKGRASNACGFPEAFDPNALYIVIASFDDSREKTETDQALRPSLVNRIDNWKILNRKELPVHICHLKDIVLNQRDEARQILKSNFADLAIWGKVRGVSDEKGLADIGLTYVASDTLIKWAGGKLDTLSQNTYQENVSIEEVQEGFLLMGGKEFDSWLADMYNLKVGRQIPDFYYIRDDWPEELKIQGFLNRGRNFFELKKYEEALSNFQLVMEMDDASSEGYYQAGRACYEMGRWNETLEYCSRALRLDSLYSLAYNIRGLANEALYEYEKAIEDYTEAIAIDPTFSAAYNNRGLIKKHLGQYEEAIEDYNLALAYDSVSFHTFSNRGVALSRLGQTQQAIEDFSRALEINPSQEVVLGNRGYAYYQIRQYDRAIEDCSKAIRIKPEYANAYAVWGIALRELGKLRDALDKLDRAIELEPGRPAFYLYRGNTYEQLRQYDHAVRDYTAALAIKEEYAEAYLGRGRVKRRIGQYAEALLDLERALEIQGESAEIYFELGRVYQKSGLSEQALQAYSGAIGLSPSQPLYYYWRATLNLQNARFGPAARDYWPAFRFAPARARALSLALVIIVGGTIVFLIRKKWRPFKKLPKT